MLKYSLSIICVVHVVIQSRNHVRSKVYALNITRCALIVDTVACAINYMLICVGNSKCSAGNIQLVICIVPSTNPVFLSSRMLFIALSSAVHIPKPEELQFAILGVLERGRGTRRLSGVTKEAHDRA